MKLRSAAVVAGLALGLMSGAAKAATISSTYDFVSTYTSGPNPKISGSVTLTYDPSINGPIIVSNFNSPELANYTPVYATVVSGDAGYIAFGNGCSQQSCGVSSQSDQFYEFFKVDNNGDVVDNYGLVYTIGSQNSTYFSATDIVVKTMGVSAVPLPSAAPMFGVGLMAFGAVGYGLKQKGKAAAAA